MRWTPARLRLLERITKGEELVFRNRYFWTQSPDETVQTSTVWSQVEEGFLTIENGKVVLGPKAKEWLKENDKH